MSWLSDFVRTTTGQGIGENVGGYVGGAIGGSAGAVLGSKIGGGITGAIDTDVGQATAVEVAPQRPAETGTSGERMQRMSYNRNIQPASYVPQPSMQYNNPNIQPALGGLVIQGGRAVGQAAGSAGKNLFPFLFGGAAAASPYIIDALTGEPKKLRVTRKLKSDVKKAVEMFGADAVAEQMGTSIDVVFYILTKKMRNDGPYVTKAAVRKTRATVRKMKTMCDLYDDLRPAAKRRAPTRRAAGATRITTVK